MREDARQRATEFVKELYAAGAIDAERLDTTAERRECAHWPRTSRRR